MKKNRIVMRKKIYEPMIQSLHLKYVRNMSIINPNI